MPEIEKMTPRDMHYIILMGLYDHQPKFCNILELLSSLRDYLPEEFEEGLIGPMQENGWIEPSTEKLMEWKITPEGVFYMDNLPMNREMVKERVKFGKENFFPDTGIFSGKKLAFTNSGFNFKEMKKDVWLYLRHFYPFPADIEDFPGIKAGVVDMVFCKAFCLELEQEGKIRKMDDAGLYYLAPGNPVFPGTSRNSEVDNRVEELARVLDEGENKPEAPPKDGLYAWLVPFNFPKTRGFFLISLYAGGPEASLAPRMVIAPMQKGKMDNYSPVTTLFGAVQKVLEGVENSSQLPMKIIQKDLDGIPLLICRGVPPATTKICNPSFIKEIRAKYGISDVIGAIPREDMFLLTDAGASPRQLARFQRIILTAYRDKEKGKPLSRVILTFNERGEVLGELSSQKPDESSPKKGFWGKLFGKK